MVAAYDNWERLVEATLRREQLRITALRTPSDISLASSSSFSFSDSNFSSSSPFNFSGLLVGDSFSYQQILHATDYLSSSNIIHLSGILYYGVLEDGIQVVVKKVDPSSPWQESLLRSELEFYGKVSHPRFVPLLGHCLENWNEKFLVYKYMPNKDLSSSISSSDWSTRLKIGIGVAEGLCYLHHECVPPLVHRHIEASSILIDENFEARLGRLIQVCTERKERNQSRILRLLRLPKGYGQGTSDASNATCAYDVYCFGKVLLELITGKLVFTAGNDSTTRYWMANALAYITTYDKELLLHITDPSLIMDDHLFNEVWAVANVAKACLSPKPSERPQMAHIIEALRDPMYIRFSTQGRPQSGSVGLAPVKMRKPERNKLGTSQVTDNTKFSGSSTTLPTRHFSAVSDDEEVYLNVEDVEPSNARIYKFSELKAATGNFRSEGFLGEGGFGRVYKGWIHDKSTSNSNSGLPIAVKRLMPESMQGFQEWQSEIDMLGRLSHPNLIKLLGSCSDDDELILVYEFMAKGSLQNHLFRRGSAVRALPWDIRLKILTGAARGLAYLHAANIIHRGVQSSNILLDGAYNAKISDFGLARMGPLDGQSHVTTRVMGTYGYAAPEYIATGHLNVKSDVYSFGVVLAETLTGLRVVDNSRPDGKQNLVEWIKPQLSEKRRIKNVMDPLLEGKYSTKAAVKMALLALMCLNNEPKPRPSMKQVVDELENIASDN